MGLETGAVRGVSTWYGPQDLSQSEDRALNGAGNVRERVVQITATNFLDVDFTLPKGAIILDSFVEVTEAFVLGGTTPTIALGTDSSAPTNSIVDVTEANAEAIGTYLGVPAGTMTSPLAAATAIAVELGGSSPTITDVGIMFVHFRYRVDLR